MCLYGSYEIILIDNNSLKQHNLEKKKYTLKKIYCVATQWMQKKVSTIIKIHINISVNSQIFQKKYENVQIESSITMSMLYWNKFLKKYISPATMKSLFYWTFECIH